jgi:hypothetical protein
LYFQYFAPDEEGTYPRMAAALRTGRDHFTSYNACCKAATAFAGTLGGNIGYFGTILASDVWLTRRKLAGEGKRLTTRIFLKIIRALLIEFGVAEILDSLFIRPALLYYLPIWMNDLTWGLIAGKFLADITFYIPAIISFELSRKKFRDFE